MTINGIVQIALYMVVLLALAKPLGWYMARVYEGQPVGLNRVFGPVERLLYRCFGTREDAGDELEDLRDRDAAVQPARACWSSTCCSGCRHALPLNPQALGAVTPDSSFNTAVSFASNTNWQGYGGEVTMSYLTQMLGLTVQNFVSAASGMAMLVALIRGLRLRTAQTIGNFWVDLTRSTLYILLPLSLILALMQVSQGVVQNFNAYQPVRLLQPQSYERPVLDAADNPALDATGNEVIETVQVTEQVLPMGPAASQIAIKQLGTNGGGFFNVNSAHPFENPTPLSNFFEMLAILLIPAALCYTFGKMVGDTRQGWAVLAAMTLIFVPLLARGRRAEAANPPHWPRWAWTRPPAMCSRAAIWRARRCASASPTRRCGPRRRPPPRMARSTPCTTSYTPLGGLVPMFLMQLGEVIYGGVGSGLYGMLIFAIIAVFVAGLMVGRTPEYLGKKIEAYEMKMASLVILIPAAGGAGLRRWRL